MQPRCPPAPPPPPPLNHHHGNHGHNATYSSDPEKSSLHRRRWEGATPVWKKKSPAASPNLIYSTILSTCILLALSLVYLRGLWRWSAPTSTDMSNSAVDAGTGNGVSWHKYVRAPSSRTVKPVGIISQNGNVTNAEAILTETSGKRLLLSRNKDQGPAEVVIDFGQNYAGILQIEFAGGVSFGEDGGKAAPGLQLAFSETKKFLTDRSDFTRSDNAGEQLPNTIPKLTNGTDQIAVKSGPFTWTDIWGCEHGESLQVCRDGLHGFRYLKIYLNALPEDAPYTTSYGSVAIKSISLLYSPFLGTPDTFTGFFECSDSQLTQWWYDGVYTTDLNTDTFRKNDTEPRQGYTPTLDGKMVLHDGPKRDRDPYMGDLAVAALTSYLSHDVPEASLNVLADLADHQRADGWIPPASIRNYELPLYDYPLWWVVCSWEYVLYTGDEGYLQQYYSHLVNVLEGSFYGDSTNNETGLLEKPAGYGDYAFLGRSETPATYYNSLYVLALQAAAESAQLLGHPADADRWRKRAFKVSEAVVEKLWDPTVGAFFDICSADSCQAHAQDGNGVAVMAGVADKSHGQKAMDYLATALRQPYGNAFYDAPGGAISADYPTRVYAFISFFELSARFILGDADSALEEIRRLYGTMSQGDPGVTFWEGIKEGGQPYEDAFTSMAHGWSTGVVPLLSNYVLGVRPTGPGFKSFVVKPVPGDVTWARGAVAVPGAAGSSGNGGTAQIKVRWERDDGSGSFFLWVDAPANTAGEVSVPVKQQGVNVLLDGNSVEGAKVEDGYVTVKIQGGKGVRRIGYTGSKGSWPDVQEL